MKKCKVYILISALFLILFFSPILAIYFFSDFSKFNDYGTLLAGVSAVVALLIAPYGYEKYLFRESLKERGKALVLAIEYLNYIRSRSQQLSKDYPWNKIFADSSKLEKLIKSYHDLKDQDIEIIRDFNIHRRRTILLLNENEVAVFNKISLLDTTSLVAAITFEGSTTEENFKKITLDKSKKLEGLTDMLFDIINKYRKEIKKKPFKKDTLFPNLDSAN